MSELKVDKISPKTGTAMTVGDSGDTFTVPSGATLTVAGALNVTGTTSLADGTVAVAELDIDGATDINAAIVAADLFVVDDGASGANRKTAASRIKTFVEASAVAVTGNVTATGTIEPAGDTAANDNAAIGYTSAEGLILTGQGSTNDVTIKNDADADVIKIPTGTTNVTVVGDLTVTGDDLFMATNTSGAVLVADGTNFNPVVISGDATVSTAGALTIAANAVEGSMLNTDSISAQTALTAEPADTDEFMVSDAGVLKRMDYSLIKGGGRATLIDTITLSDQATAVFDSSDITNTYDVYLMVFENIQLASGNRELRMRISNNNGSSYEGDSGNDYRKLTMQLDDQDSNGNANTYFGANETFIMVCGSGRTIGNDAALKIDGHMYLQNLNTSSYKKFISFMTYGDATDPPIFCYETAQHIADETQAVINNVKVYSSSGNLNTGKIKLFGLA